MKAILKLLMLALLALAPALASQEPEAKGRGYIPLTPEKLEALHAVSQARHGNRIERLAANQALPAAFDCRQKVPLPIWDQGSCGSCYLVATVRTATCALLFIGTGKADNSFMISAQYGMDRPRNFGGCGGGNGTEVIAWMLQHGWPCEIYTDAQGVVHKDYPAYEARSGSDRMKAGAKLWMTSASGATWGFVQSAKKFAKAKDGSLHLAAPPTEQIKASLFNYGRQNIAIDAGGGFGANGTITSLGNSIDHEINMVAYDDAHDNGDGTKGAFLLENQWGEGWSGTGGGPGCKWCSYKASQHIVDHFFVSAGPLPPPPDPGPCPTPGTFVIVPATASVLPKGTVQFDAASARFWHVVEGGGAVSQTGLYTAPDTVGQAKIMAVGGTPLGIAYATVTISNTPPPPTGPTIVIGPDVKPGTYVLLKFGQEIASAGTTAKLEALRAFFAPDPPKIEEKKMPPPEPEATTEPPIIINEPEPVNYETIKAESLRTGKLVVVGIGGKAAKGDWLRYETTAPWGAWQRECTLVMQPRKDGYLHELHNLPPNANANTINVILGK